MSKLFLIAGTKGGIGKSYFATFLVDIAYKNNFKVHIFDADEENQTLSNFYQKMPDIAMRGIIRQGTDYPLDFIVDEVAKVENIDNADEKGNHIYVVDMKAGTSAETLDWIQAFPVDEMLAWKVDIVIVGCFTSDVDSVVTFLPWVKQFLPQALEKKLKFLVVKNFYHGDDFSFYSKNLQSVLETDLQSVVVTLMPLEKLSYKLKLRKQSYGRILDAWKTTEWLYMEQHRARREFRLVSEALTPFFSIPGKGGKK